MIRLPRSVFLFLYNVVEYNRGINWSICLTELKTKNGDALLVLFIYKKEKTNAPTPNY